MADYIKGRLLYGKSNIDAIYCLANAIIAQAAMDYVNSKKWIIHNMKDKNLKDLLKNGEENLCKRYIYYDNIYQDSLNFLKSEDICLMSNVNVDYLLSKLDDMVNDNTIRKYKISISQLIL